MRATQTHAALAEVARFPEAARILDRIGAERVAKVRAQLPIAWVDFADHFAVSEAVHEIVGRDEYIQYWRRVMVSTLSVPLVAGLVRLSTRGLGPVRLLGNAHLVYGTICRGLGTFRMEDAGPTSCVIWLRGFPASDHSLSIFADGMAGSILGACDKAGAPGEVETTLVSERDGDARYVVTWS